MKMKRFASVFFILALVLSLVAVPLAAPAEEGGSAPVMEVAAKAALLVDGDTGEVLYAKNEHDELYPASITKVMTALLVLEAVDSGKLSMDEQITVTATALEGLADDGSSANIKEGETMSVENLLYCMLVVSANEACNILGERVSGSVDAFVERMNQRAEELGCANTHFVNATGLHDPKHYTSAWDIYLITKEAMGHPDFMTICNTAQITVPATNLSEARVLHTTNYLLSNWRAIGYTYSAARGIKTGSTSDAGYCLVSSAVEGSRSLISVVLGAERVSLTDGKTQTQSFSETKRLFEWGFNNFSRKTILTQADMIQEVPVSLSKDVNYVVAHPASDVEALLPNSLEPESLKRRVTLYQDTVEAPVEKGDVLGEVTLSYEDRDYATVKLLAYDSIEASRLLVLQKNVKDFFSKTIVKVILVILLLLVLLLAGWKLTVGRRRYRYGRKVGRGRNYRGRRR